MPTLEATLTAQGYDVETEHVDYLETQQTALQYVLYDPTVLAVLLYGGVRGGKSFAGCKAAIQVLEHFPGANVLLARDTRVNLEATTLKTLWGTDKQGNPVLPYGIYDERDHNQTKGFINWPNSGYLSMMGLDSKQNIERVKSSEWSFVVLEEVTGIAWKIVKFIVETRMTHSIGPRKLLLTTNTDRGEDEVYKFFFNDHTCNPDKFCANCPDGRCQFRRILADTLANRKNLPPEYIKRTEHLAKTDPRYHAIYMKGQFANVSGSIFPEYNERIHILDVPAGWEAPAEWNIERGYDHGWGGAPCCELDALIVPDGTIIFADEIYTDPTNRPDVKVVSSLLHDRGITYIGHADPSIRNKNQYRSEGEDITSVQALFQDHGVMMELADNDVNGGIERIKTLLTPDPDHKCPVPGAAIEGLPNQPYIYILRVGGYLRCPNLNRQFKKYRNRENLRGEQNPKKWDPVPEDDHALDPARYIINGRPMPAKFRPPEPEQGTSSWAHKLQLKKKAIRDPSALNDSGGGFRMVGSGPS